MELPAFPAVGVVRRILNSPSGAVCWVAITVWFKWNLVPISNEFSSIRIWVTRPSSEVPAWKRNISTEVVSWIVGWPLYLWVSATTIVVREIVFVVNVWGGRQTFLSPNSIAPLRSRPLISELPPWPWDAPPKMMSIDSLMPPPLEPRCGIEVVTKSYTSDREYFDLTLYSLHEKKYALVG